MTPHSALPSRREVFKNTALGFGSLALSSLLTQESSAEVRKPHFEPKAKRVIFMFMKGGPSAIDTFDPKPLLDRDHGKPFPGTRPRVTFAKTGTLLKSPWKFKQYGKCGQPVSDLFPHVAKCVDDICFVHSLHGTNPAHGGAAMKLHTGSDNFVRPSMGAWVAYGLGSENANLPAFVTICPTLAHGGFNNWGSSFLPASTNGVPLGNASIPVAKAQVRYIKPGQSADVQRRQLDLLAEMNREHLTRTGPDAALEGRIDAFELAFRLQSAVPDVEDISKESEKTKSLYGIDDPITENFGRQCLLARRFAERGVRFVQVTHSDPKVQWDQHGNLKQGHAEKALEVDKPIAGLLADLKARGMLHDTLVLWGGEFGRTPTVEGSADGRDHNPEGFTVWMAGGGVKPGFRYGATDDYGWFAEKDKVHVHDLHATMLHLLGMDHERLTFRHAGRDFRLTDVHGRVVKEIIA
ncbi:MAG: DUF1501 domain-containing protein [Gemmataceae bacterium]|nr:DUF1501 domain-containing protein [Gemmataceae bacterium]